MSALRGFGFHMDIRGGTTRHWYAGADGVRRWADNDAPVDIPTPDPLAADEASEGMCALPELSDAQIAEGNETEIRR